MEEDPSWLRLSRSEMRGSGSGVAGVSESVGAGAAIPVGAGAGQSILSQPWLGNLTPAPAALSLWPLTQLPRPGPGVIII